MATPVLVSLSDMKTWLRYANPTQSSPDDSAIQSVINAAVEIIELHTGVNVPKSYTEKHNGGDCTIWLRRTPVISVDEILESLGFVQFALDFQDASTAPIVVPGHGTSGGTAATSVYAYSIDDYQAGVVSRRSAGNALIPFARGQDNIQVTYTAGRETPSAACVLACKEMVAHVWQNSQLRAQTMSGTNIAYDSTMGDVIRRPSEGTQIWVGIPSRILQLLESERRMPIIG